MGAVELRLLGPLELVVHGNAADLGGPRGRITLAMLALNPGRMITVDQLVDAIWGTSPPHTARSQIQTCISALRKLFAGAGLPDAITTHPAGYVLRIAAESLDTEQFSSLVAQARADDEQGRTSEAAIALRAALALWRGPALTDVPSDLVQRGAVLLGERRLAAAEERLRIELALGRHREVSGEIQALVAEHPLREDLYRLLMLALYRSGRQADALEVSRNARATFIEELGLEPGTELQDLERAILNRDPALDLPEVPRSEPVPREERTAEMASEPGLIPRQLPASVGDFTGRDSQIAAIMQLMSGDAGLALAPYAVRIAAISGKGGVGKSALAVRVAHELDVLFPDGQLYARFSAPEDAREAAEVLARFVRALGVSGPAVPSDLYERTELYRSRLAGKRILVVLDDVSSEEQVLPFLPGSHTCAVITTSRARLTGLPGALWVNLDMFDAETSLDLLSKIIGAERLRVERDAAVELVNLCEGLPLALRITGARLASRPHWPILALVERLRGGTSRLDQFAHQRLDLRANIGLSYRALGQRARQLFRLFALVQAADFPGWTAAALLDTSLADAEDVLESLVEAQLLNAVSYSGMRQPRYGFHELIREYAREQLMESETDASRREALGRMLGAWLALAEDAHRMEYGGDYTILHGQTVRWRPMGGRTADIIGSPADWWESERSSLTWAVKQAAAAGMDELCWDLALASVDLFEARGYFDDWRETSQLACEAAERASNRQGHAAMLYSLGTLNAVHKRLADAERCFAVARAMFTADQNVHGCALVLRNWALVDGLLGNIEGMLAKYTEALETMRAVGDRIGEAHVLSHLAKFRIDEGETGAANEMLDEALAICRDVHCVRVEAQVLYRFAELYIVTDRIELARQALNQVLRIVRDTGDRIGEARALYGFGILRQREGRLDGAQTTLLHGLALARRLGERLVEGQGLYALGEIALVKGDNATARSRLEEAQRIFEELSSALWHARTLIVMSEIHVADGQFTAAWEDVDRAVMLLSGIHSKESEWWLARLEERKSALAVSETSRGGLGIRLPGT